MRITMLLGRVRCILPPLDQLNSSPQPILLNFCLLKFSDFQFLAQVSSNRTSQGLSVSDLNFVTLVFANVDMG